MEGDRNPPGWHGHSDGWNAVGYGSGQAQWQSGHDGWHSWGGSSSSSAWQTPGWDGHRYWDAAASTLPSGPGRQWGDGGTGGWESRRWDDGGRGGWRDPNWRDDERDGRARRWREEPGVDREWHHGAQGGRAGQWHAGDGADRGRDEPWSRARGHSTEQQRSSASASSQPQRPSPGRGVSSSSSGAGGWARPRREQPVGFWRSGEWVGRERTSSEERAQRGGQGPVRQARRGRLRQQWLEGTFRPAAFHRGVDRTSDAAVRARAQFAAILGGAAQHATGGWSRQQWEDWEGWAINSVLVVDWVQDGLPSEEDVQYMEEDDEAGFLQLGGYAELEVDAFSMMELTADEEELLAELHLPDAVRRSLREMLRTLQRHDAEDQGPEYRWATAEWVASWDQACVDLSRVVQCLRRRLGVEGPVEYWPIVRTPRAAAQRVRSLQWARQWTPVVMPLLETLVDCHMVQRVDAVPVQPRQRGGPASRSRSRDTDSTDGDSSGMGGRPRRVSRARRRVGTAEGRRDAAPVPPPLGHGAASATGRATMDSPVPAGANVAGVGHASLVPAAPASLTRGTPGGGTGSVDGAPAVRLDSDVDGASLVQRLQPGEARELQRLGVRRDTITALGLFLGELASVCDGTHPGSDVAPEDVQWALRVVERALFLSAGTQDFIASILAARLPRGREGCVLPDGDGRGGVVQMAHAFVVGAARTYLDDLQNLLADAWVNPESLPEELRRDPAGGVAAGGYGEDAEEDEVRPVVVAPGAAELPADVALTQPLEVSDAVVPGLPGADVAASVRCS